MARIVEFHSSEQPHMSMSESLNYGLIEPLIYRDLDGVLADIPAACCRRCGEVTLRSNMVASHLCTTDECIERLKEVGMQAFRRVVAEKAALADSRLAGEGEDEQTRAERYRPLPVRRSTRSVRRQREETMPNEAARLVDELTTLLYEVIKRWQLPDGRVCEIVRCGACRRKADRAESVVHDSDCPVYRLIRAEEANTAVIRANADEIADLEDRRDELETQVNALTARLAAAEAALREAALALDIARKNAGQPDPHWYVADVTRVARDKCRAALAGSHEQVQGEGRDGE